MVFFYKYSLLSVVLPFLIFVILLCKWFSKPKRHLPPSPPKLPIIGNLHQLGSYPHRSLQSIARQYGPIMMLNLGSVPVLIISSAEGAREIMKTHDLVFSSRPKLRIPSRLLYDCNDIAFAPYGEYWRQVKSLSVVHLLNNTKVRPFHSVREEETRLMIQGIRLSSASSSLVNLSEKIISLTSDVICRITLGKKYAGESLDTLLEFAELLGVFDVGDYIPWLGWVNRFNGLDSKVQKVARELDAFLEGVLTERIEKRRNRYNSGEKKFEGGDQDFLDILLQIQDDQETGLNLQWDTIKALILEMFAAGTHTTSTMLTWAIAELLRNPEAMRRLQNEVKGEAQGKSEIKEQDLEKLGYLKAVMKETLRLHSPVPLLVARKSVQDVKVMNYDIPSQTQVFVNAWAIGRDPSSWKEPNAFMPERFMNSRVNFKGTDFELIPFGAGRRACPGISFAQSINELVLANLVLNFDLDLPNGIDMTEASGITISLKNPIYVTAISCH